MGRSSELAQRVVRCVSGEIKGGRKKKKRKSENKKKERTGCAGSKGKDLRDRRHKSAGKKRSGLAAWGIIC